MSLKRLILLQLAIDSRKTKGGRSLVMATIDAQKAAKCIQGLEKLEKLSLHLGLRLQPSHPPNRRIRPSDLEKDCRRATLLLGRLDSPYRMLVIP